MDEVERLTQGLAQAEAEVARLRAQIAHRDEQIELQGQRLDARVAAGGRGELERQRLTRRVLDLEQEKARRLGPTLSRTMRKAGRRLIGRAANPG